MSARRPSFDPKERHQFERQALARRHAREKLDIARLKRMNSRIETREKQALEKALRRDELLARELDGKAQHDFTEAAHDHAQQQSGAGGDDDRTVSFNDAAEFSEGADRAGDDDDDRASGWKQRAAERSRARRPRRGKSFGFSRDKPQS